MLKVKGCKILLHVSHYRRWWRKEIQESVPPPKQLLSWQKLSEIISLKLWSQLEHLQCPGESLMKKLVNFNKVQ